jgi:hypothetical protein
MSPSLELLSVYYNNSFRKDEIAVISRAPAIDQMLTGASSLVSFSEDDMLPFCLQYDLWIFCDWRMIHQPSRQLIFWTRRIIGSTPIWLTMVFWSAAAERTKLPNTRCIGKKCTGKKNFNTAYTSEVTWKQIFWRQLFSVWQLLRANSSDQL